MALAEAIYLLCTVTSGLAAVLLVRRYRASRSRLLWWSALAFVGFTANNALVLVDLAMLRAADLALVRSVIAMAAILALVYGLVKEGRP